MNDKYIELEKELIIKTKEVVRLDPIFKDDFDLESDDNIIKGIKLYINKYHMSEPNQVIAIDIFRKNGLWKDGKTTLEERDQQILDEKVAASIAYKALVLKKKTRVMEFKLVIDKKIQEIEEMPMKIILNLDKKRDKIQDDAYTKLNEIESDLIGNLTKMVKESVKQFKSRQSFVLLDLKKQLDKLKQEERFRIDSQLKEYDAVIGMQREFIQVSDRCDVEINHAEKLIETTDIKLFDMTVKELKILAEKKGIDVPVRILKADLITLIEGV